MFLLLVAGDEGNGSFYNAQENNLLAAPIVESISLPSTTKTILFVGLPYKFYTGLFNKNPQKIMVVVVIGIPC